MSHSVFTFVAITGQSQQLEGTTIWRWWSFYLHHDIHNQHYDWKDQFQLQAGWPVTIWCGYSENVHIIAADGWRLSELSLLAGIMMMTCLIPTLKVNTQDPYWDHALARHLDKAVWRSDRGTRPQQPTKPTVRQQESSRIIPSDWTDWFVSGLLLWDEVCNDWECQQIKMDKQKIQKVIFDNMKLVVSNGPKSVGCKCLVVHRNVPGTINPTNVHL